MTMGNKIEELTKNVRLVDDLAKSGKEMGWGTMYIQVSTMN